VPKTTAKPKQKATRKKPVAVKELPSPRRLELPKRIWYKPFTWRHRRPVPNYKKLPKARVVFVDVLRDFKNNWLLFGGIVLIFGVFNLILVRGLSGSNNLSDFKGLLDSAVHGLGGQLASSAITFSYLLASSGSNNTGASGVYQVTLLIVCSLAFVWALRQVAAKHKVRIRDSFYQGMYPLIPALLLVALIALQLVPLAAGGGLYAAAVNHDIAINWWERIIFIVIFAVLGLWTLRMLTASLFALYIVTLPDMTPLRAYRSARDLVYGRRLYIWRKLIFLPIVLFLLVVLIMIPLIMWLTPVAEWAFFALTMMGLPLVHGYLYKLYREML
jgi:hypothetical protein